MARVVEDRSRRRRRGARRRQGRARADRRDGLAVRRPRRRLCAPGRGAARARRAPPARRPARARRGRLRRALGSLGSQADRRRGRARRDDARARPRRPVEPRPSRSPSRTASAGRIAGTVYGTIVVMATVAAGGKGRVDAWQLAAFVVATVVVLWLAHVYAHGLAESIERGRRLDGAELAVGRAARDRDRALRGGPVDGARPRRRRGHPRVARDLARPRALPARAGLSRACVTRRSSASGGSPRSSPSRQPRPSGS